MVLEQILSSTRDTLLVGTPLLVLLFIGFFRLDELMLKPKKSQVPLAPAGKAA